MIQILNGSYEPIGLIYTNMNGRGNFAYFAKCKNKMNYMNGQIACKKTGGFMVEFNFKDDYIGASQYKFRG